MDELPRIYAAHPIASYGTSHGRRCMKAIAKALPGVELVDPEALAWETGADWLPARADVLASLDALVCSDPSTGSSGRGACARSPTPSPPASPSPGPGVMRTTTRIRHRAQFSDSVLDVLAELVPDGTRVLNPFAGTGRVHELGTRIVGVEPEWASVHSRTIVADVRALPFTAETFDMNATSPAYGNRLADHHEARDGSVRRSCRHDRGQPLHRQRRPVPLVTGLPEPARDGVDGGDPAADARRSVRPQCVGPHSPRRDLAGDRLAPRDLGSSRSRRASG